MKFLIDLHAVKTDTEEPEVLTVEQVRDWLKHYALSEDCEYETKENIADDPTLEGPGPYLRFELFDVEVTVLE